MAKILFSPQRNVENIRRKNVEDNQIFLQNLCMTNIRHDFLRSARAVLRKHGSSQIEKKHAVQQHKIDRTTRYNEKVKSGEIGPFIPEWQRQLDEKKKEAEKRLLEKERKKLETERKRQEHEIKKQAISLERERKRLEIERKRREYEIKRDEILFQKLLRQVERQLELEGKERRRLARKRPHKCPKWILLYKNSDNGNPYQRTFQPRHTKVGERVQQNLF